jgi:hypothetical protein
MVFSIWVVISFTGRFIAWAQETLTALNVKRAALEKEVARSASGTPWCASAKLPVIAPIVSLSPPTQMALQQFFISALCGVSHVK